MRLYSIKKVFTCRESGVSLIETLVALAVLGAIAVTFLSGLVVTSEAAFIVDERATAESLARNQMEWVQSVSYNNSATQYSPAPIPSGLDYADYSANITAVPLNSPDDGIQKITVVVNRFGKPVITLETYKVKR